MCGMNSRARGLVLGECWVPLWPTHNATDVVDMRGEEGERAGVAAVSQEATRRPSAVSAASEHLGRSTPHLVRLPFG